MAKSHEKEVHIRSCDFHCFISRCRRFSDIFEIMRLAESVSGLRENFLKRRQQTAPFIAENKESYLFLTLMDVFIIYLKSS